MLCMSCRRLPGVPPYLPHGAPVLVHPGDYDRYDRFQPNVALMSVPGPGQAEVRKPPSAEKYSHVDVTCTEDEGPGSKSPSHAVSTITLNPSRRSPSPAPALAPPSPTLPPPPPPPPPPRPSSACSSTPAARVEEPSPASASKCKKEVSSDTEDSASECAGDNGVAAVLESLSSDERDARMARVLRSLVKRLGDVEADRGRLTAENDVLRKKAEEQEALILQQERIIQRLQQEQERLNSKHDPEAFQDKVMAMEKELRTLRCEVNRLPNGRHENVKKSNATTNPKDTEARSPVRRESTETNIAVSVIHKSESQTLSGSE
ncbi:Myosin-1B [Frankliniella fusca]|uniref:Myosin-1B n=1 Tax=Frankliniella fusca TaxID=407009 RepID=A0AAE1H5V2_9NEOP|nr:Myosin-1B [Frankliniella fusca]